MTDAARAAPLNGQLSLGQERHTLDEPLLTPAEAAALLAVRTSWVYEAVRARRLPCVRIGRHVRFLRSDLEVGFESSATRGDKSGRRGGRHGPQNQPSPVSVAEHDGAVVLLRRCDLTPHVRG